MSPARRRDAVAFLMRRHKISQRRACQLVGQYRSTQRYARVIPDEEAKLISAMNTIAMVHPRWGYRMVAKLLRDGGWIVNDKRIERLWRQEGHRVAPSKAKKSGKKAEGSKQNSSRSRPALRPHHVWSYDFMSAWTTRRIPIRILNVVDEFTRRSLGSRVSRSIGSGDVIRHLEFLFERHGKPSMIRSDNGREFIAATVVEWLFLGPGSGCTLNPNRVSPPPNGSVTTQLQINVPDNGGYGGTFEFDVTGIVDRTRRTYRITVVVPNFRFACSSSQIRTFQNDFETTTCTATGQAAYSGSVELSCSGQPQGVYCNFNPRELAVPEGGSATTELTVEVGPDVPPGTYDFNVTGNSGSLTRSFPLKLIVDGP